MALNTMALNKNNPVRHRARPRTLDCCEAYLDRLADLIADAGNDWVLYRPLVERLEREAREAREEIALHERMMRRKKRHVPRVLASPLPRCVLFVPTLEEGALTLAEVWQQAQPTNMALNADDRHYLIMLCRNRQIHTAHRNGMTLAFVR